MEHRTVQTTWSNPTELTHGQLDNAVGGGASRRPFDILIDHRDERTSKDVFRSWSSSVPSQIPIDQLPADAFHALNASAKLFSVRRWNSLPAQGSEKRMNRRSLLGAIIGAAILIGCGGSSGAAWALWTARAGEIGTSVPYDTGNTTQLSAWQTVNCIGNVGGDNELITALGVYKEPSSNLDNFVDKLNITCTKYETNSGDQYQPGPDPSITTNVYTGPKPRLPGVSLKTPLQPNTVSTGVTVVVNTNSHIQDIKLRYKVWNGTNFAGGSVVTTGGATGYTGPEHAVDCPVNSVLTGLAVRYSLNSGKIRQLKALCHELRHTH
jgi:hypothetical protein